MPKFIVPSFMQDVFTCPFCDVTAKQEWYGNSHAERAYYGLSEYTLQESLKLDASELIRVDGLDTWLFAKCANCEELSVWHNNEMVYPEHCPVDEPNLDMPEAVENKYREAAKVVSLSPVSAAALLRLALQLLLADILESESTGDIYRDIDTLKKRQLDSSLIKALDIIRITGNESVHPGTIDLNESKEDALYLFDLLNMICDQCYTQPKRMQEMYEKLPESKRILKDE